MEYFFLRSCSGLAAQVRKVHTSFATYTMKTAFSK
jgi:hypothetical protein